MKYTTEGEKLTEFIQKQKIVRKNIDLYDELINALHIHGSKCNKINYNKYYGSRCKLRSENPFSIG